jgi:hypothetical protein
MMRGSSAQLERQTMKQQEMLTRVALPARQRQRPLINIQVMVGKPELQQQQWDRCHRHWCYQQRMLP